jgi:hypothetical protein
MMQDPRKDAGDAWAEATWEGHEKAQHKRMAAIPFARKLELLEEMHLRFLRMGQPLARSDVRRKDLPH